MPNVSLLKTKKMLRILIFFLFLISLNSIGQQLHLKIVGKNDLQTKAIDSIGYTKSFGNAKGILDETNLFSKKLLQAGFLEQEILESRKQNDSTFLYLYTIGAKTNFIHIYIGMNLEVGDLDLYTVNKDTLVLPFEQSETFLNSTLRKLEAKGFSMAKVQLTNLKKHTNFVSADLKVTSDKKRQWNDIVINGYDKFPEGYKNNLKRLYKKRIFNQKNLEKLYKDIGQFQFVKQTKYPEILFTKDSTKVFVYLEKAKSNSFDGFIGFSNDENRKVIFNGYLDLTLNNAMNSGEKLALYWKSNGKDQKTFRVGAEIPYVFKSPIGMKVQLNIFKQDSTYQNTQTSIDFGYYFNYNTRLYFGYQSTESSDIKNSNTLLLSDYTNKFYTSNFEFVEYKDDDYLFPEKSNFNIKIGTGRRDSKFQNNFQFYGSVNLSHNIYLNSKTYLT